MNNNVDVIATSAWMNIIRVIGALGVWMVIGLLWLGGVIDFDPRPIFFFLIPVYILTSFLWQAIVKRNIFAHPFLLGQLLVDIITVTIGIYFAGGIHSPFVFLYIIIIISATLISLKAVVVAGMAIILVYAFLIFSEITDLIPFLVGTGVIDNHDIIHSAVFLLVMILIGFQTYFFRAQTKKKEEQFDNMKDDLLFRTVHDLRSPSTVIRLIMERYDSPLWLEKHPETKEDVLLVRDANERMLNLVRDLLLAAKSGNAGIAFKKEAVALQEILHQVVKELGPAAFKKNVAIHYSAHAELPKVAADAERLKEVFSNLLDNAILYNKDGGSVFVEHRIRGSILETEVRDTGIGISDSDQANLFKQFFRAHSDHQIQGTGLGLYIVKNLVEKMGGSISVYSNPGEGTIFTVSLPIAS